MFRAIAGVSEIVAISRFQGFRKLLRHSRQLKHYGGCFAVMHSLIALEKTDLNRLLLSDEGLDVGGQEGIDECTLSTVCEYLYERGILARVSGGVYKARSSQAFRDLLQSMYACYAYLDPICAMDKLLTREYEYGRQVVRNDKYDAIASATLTSMFSYGFSHRVLKTAEARNLLDLGCGTGEYLAFLERQGFPGKLYGLDVAEDAISEGKERGFESERVRLLVGDMLDLRGSLQQIGDDSIDVVSIMFVLHEFGDDQVESVLTSLRDGCPGARVLLTELASRTSDEIRNASRTVLPELKFVHQLSKQVLRTAAEWKERFSRAGFGVAEEKENYLTSQICILFEPEGSVP